MSLTSIASPFFSFQMTKLAPLNRKFSKILFLSAHRAPKLNLNTKPGWFKGATWPPKLHINLVQRSNLAPKVAPKPGTKVQLGP